jgi:SagB-type dehydrogenase family enzyme
LSQSLFLFLRDGVSVSTPAEGELVVDSVSARIVFKQLGPGSLVALQRLASSGEHEDRLAECVLQRDGASALAKLYHYLHRLTQRGLLLRSAHDNGERVATMVPVSPQFVFAGRKAAGDHHYVLSRFAYMRRESDEIVLECPLSHARIILHDFRAAALVHALSKPRSAEELVAPIAGLSADAAALVTMLLLNSGMLQELNPPGRTPQEENAMLQCWEFHDLLFHARSRGGRHDSDVGGTYRLAGRLDPLPGLKPIQPREILELYRPDLDRQQREDPPFARVQETRRSLREYAAKPITGRQLGEFLYRVARATEYVEAEVATPHGPVRLGLASRPYPSGGALYELELYPAINACEDVVPGLHYYDPMHHRLCRLSGRTPDVQQLLTEASVYAQIPCDRLQVLLIVTARFPRIGWKYAGLAYSLVLKNVGVIYQTMYLAATAMGLAPCALGYGNADLFARAAGTDYYAETSVGEFLLGSKP